MQFALNAYMSFSTSVAGLMLFYWFTVKSLRDGVARTRYGDPTRQNEPIGFWLSVLAGILVGCAACSVAVLILLYPIKI